MHMCIYLTVLHKSMIFLPLCLSHQFQDFADTHTYRYSNSWSKMAWYLYIISHSPFSMPFGYLQCFRQSKYFINSCVALFREYYMFSAGPFFKYFKKCMYKFIERNEERRMGKRKGNKEVKS